MQKVEFLKRKKCPFEHNDASLEKILTVTDFDGETGNYDILYCPLCKIGLTSPFPSEDTLNQLYLSAESRNFDGKNSSFFDKLKFFLAERSFLKLSKKLNRNFNKILDFGTGNGKYAVAGKTVFKNSEIDAVDFSLEKPDLLKTNNEINYYHIDDFFKQNKKYDLILLRHVLEHVVNPLHFLEKMQNYLENDGILLIEVPNLKSGNAKVFKKYYSAYYAPYHIFHYTEPALKLVLQKTGYDCTINKSEIPLMSNILANISGIKSINNYLRLLGMFLYPLQLFIEKVFNSSTVLSAYAWKIDKKEEKIT